MQVQYILKWVVVVGAKRYLKQKENEFHLLADALSGVYIA